MNGVAVSQTVSVLASHRLRLALLLLFLGSGCAALIYEVVWLQLLALVIGSSAVSLGLLLGVFMAGLCVGSVASPRLISAGLQPLRVYALLELGIGCLGIGVLFLIPWVARIYASHGGPGLAGFLFRGLLCAACLFPATVLMGATLPVLARSVDTTPHGVSWLGLFYGLNTLGAVCGCLSAGFYLLRIHDMHTAVYVAAALNGMLALSACLLSGPCRAPVDGGSRSSLARTGWFWNFLWRAECKGDPVIEPIPAEQLPETIASACAISRAGGGAVYLTIALSGLCALGAEVVWTRLLSLLLGPTVYTFSIILAVFLGGLGLGSGIGSYLAQRSPHPDRLLGACQLLLSAGIAWAALMLAKSLPYWPINPALSRVPGSISSSTRCAALGPFCRRPACGEPVSTGPGGSRAPLR